MLYRILAESVLVTHLLFVLFVVFGGLLVVWRRWVVWGHLPAVLWGALVELMGWPCPLTPLEKLLRRLAGQEGYEGGFIEHVIVGVLYPGELTRGHQIALGLVVVAINAAVYGWVWKRRGRGVGGREK